MSLEIRLSGDWLASDGFVAFGCGESGLLCYFASPMRASDVGLSL
jgi:hypothetical protein